MTNNTKKDCMMLSIESLLGINDTEFTSNIKINKISNSSEDTNTEQECKDSLLFCLMTCDALIQSRYKMLKQNNADFKMLEAEREEINKFFEDIVERNQKKFFPETYPSSPDWVREYLANKIKDKNE